ITMGHRQVDQAAFDTRPGEFAEIRLSCLIREHCFPGGCDRPDVRWRRSETARDPRITIKANQTAERSTCTEIIHRNASVRSALRDRKSSSIQPLNLMEVV